MTNPYRAYTRRTRTKAPRQSPEHDLQVSLVKVLRLVIPKDMRFSATLNGAHLGPSQRSKMKASGMNSGPLDIVFIWKPWRGVNKWAEAKWGKNGLTLEQKEWIDICGPENCCVFRSIEEVLDFLRSQGVPLRQIDFDLHLIRA